MPRFYPLFFAASLATASAFAVTYSQDVKPILDAHCIECHDGVSHDPDLTTFPFSSATLPTQQAVADEILQKTGGASPEMPPGNRPKLSAGEVATIQQWRNGGMQP